MIKWLAVAIMLATSALAQQTGGGQSGNTGSGTVGPNNGVANEIGIYGAAGGSTTIGPDGLLIDNQTTLAYTGPGGFSTPSVTSNGSGAGMNGLTQGADNSANCVANTVCDEAPTSITTSYTNIRPAAAPSALSVLASGAVASAKTTQSFLPTSNTAGTGIATFTGALTNGHAVCLNANADFIDCGANFASTNIALLANAAAFTTALTDSVTIGSATFQGTATNTAVTVTGGVPATTTGVNGTVTVGGESVTGGSTASVVGATATFRGGDNASSGATETAGATTVRGGDTTNGSAATNTAGGLTIRGGNVSSTSTTSVAGAVSITGGSILGAATNAPGADVTFAGGLGTGNAAPSHVKLQSPAFVSASGTGAQANVTSYIVHKKSGSTTSATATNMFQIAVAANQTIGVEVIVHVETTQATPHNCSTTENFIAAVQNTSATVTSQATAGTIGTICDTGTLTLAVAFSAATPSVFSVTPTWTTVVPSAVVITVEVHNLSQQDIATL